MLMRLDVAELFTIETCMKMPMIQAVTQSRIAVLRYLPAVANAQPDEISAAIDTMHDNSKVLLLLQTSPSLKVLLKTVLSLGNLTNHQYSRRQTNESQAVGFKIESLPKLRDVKARDGKSTLINYLVEVLWGVPAMLSLPDEFEQAGLYRVKEYKCLDMINTIMDIRQLI